MRVHPSYSFTCKPIRCTIIYKEIQGKSQSAIYYTSYLTCIYIACVLSICCSINIKDCAAYSTRTTCIVDDDERQHILRVVTHINVQFCAQECAK